MTARDVARNDSAHFVAFLEEIDDKIDPELQIHVVLDNGSSHRSRATKAWFESHPRFVVHHTPLHASWLNQLECFFSILTGKLLRRGVFASREELVQKMMAFIERHSETDKPFCWVYDAKVAA